MADRDVFLIEVARRGRDSVPAPPDYATMRSDIALVKNRANITKLTDVPDVNTGAASGQILVRNTTTNRWEPKSIQSGLASVFNQNTPIASDVRYLYAHDGLSATVASASDGAVLRPTYGGTGSAKTVARSDHSHTDPVRGKTDITPGGYMSSGTRQLGTVALVLRAGVRYLVLAKLRQQMRGADSGPCYFRQFLVTGGVTLSTPGGTSGKWCVQGVPNDVTLEHQRFVNGTGQSVDINAAVSYYGGGGFYTDFGTIEVVAFPSK